MNSLESYERILVIKLGALGDFVQAMGAMAVIRRAHPKAQITLLTTAPYAGLAEASGYFDSIEIGGRPKGLRQTLALARLLRRGRYQRVYDLQTSSRSSNYLYLFAPSLPEWSGIAPLASHRHRNPRRDRMQNLDRLWDQLAEAGVVESLAEGLAPGPDLSWAVAKAPAPLAERFAIKAPYALLSPGASPGRPLKRWPPEGFIAVARMLEEMGVQPVVVGGPQELELGETILAGAPSSLLLAGRTSLVELAALGFGAALVVGNDTGPTYLTAFSGAPTLILFSADSDPDLCAPRLPNVMILQKDDLADLSALEVTNSARLLLGRA